MQNGRKKSKKKERGGGKRKSNTSYNGGNWHHLKIIKKILNVTGKQKIKELQTTARLGNVHTL
jgi:hypothetical protein